MGDVHTYITFGALAVFAPIFARTYLRYLGSDVRLWLISAFLVGACTMFGGTYGALMNLYLLKLGQGPDVIGFLNTAFYVGMALIATLSGLLVRLLGGIRNSAATGIVMCAVGQVTFPLPTLLGAEPSFTWLAVTLMLASGGITLYAVNIWPFMASRIRIDKREYGFAGHLGLVPIGGMLGTAISGQVATAIEGGPDAGASALAATLCGSGIMLLGAVAALLAIPKQPLINVESVESVESVEPVGPGQPAAPQDGSAAEVARGAFPMAIIAMMIVVMIFDVSGEGVGRVFKNVYMATDLKLDTGMVTRLISYGQLAAALAVFSTPLLIRRLGLSWTFILTTLGMSLGLGIISTIPHWLAAGIGYALLIGFSQMARAAKTQYAMEIVEPYYRPHLSGFMQFAETGTVSVLASLGGFALANGTLTFPGLFNLVALSTSLAAVFFWLFFVRRPPGQLPRGQ